MRSFQYRARVTLLVALGLAVVAPASATSPAGFAPAATRAGGVVLTPPRTLGIAADTSLTCFEGSLSLVLNPGCFAPPGNGDCVSHSRQYFVQYIFPSFTKPHVLKGFGFISNDGATVFPAAGALVVPDASLRFPRPGELDSLPVRNVSTPHDTAIVIVDLRSYHVVVQPGYDVAICLRFPEGGQLTAIGVGPGILVDADAPDQPCDYFTIDGGQNYYSNASNDPLDWGFEAIFEPLTAIEATSWSDLKRLYGGERVFPYKKP